MTLDTLVFFACLLLGLLLGGIPWLKSVRSRFIPSAAAISAEFAEVSELHAVVTIPVTVLELAPVASKPRTAGTAPRWKRQPKRDVPLHAPKLAATTLPLLI